MGYLSGALRVCPASWWSGSGGYSYDSFSYSAFTDETDPFFDAQVGTYYYTGGGSHKTYLNTHLLDFRYSMDQVVSASDYLMLHDWLAPLENFSKRDAFDNGKSTQWDQYKHSNHDSWENPSGGNSLWADGHVQWNHVDEWARIQHGSQDFSWAPPGSYYVHDSSWIAVIDGVLTNISSNPNRWTDFKKVFNGTSGPEAY
jgi:prepilin-type processing-associated H-X9-DG protein